MTYNWIGDYMLKIILKIVKRIIFSSFLLYGYNLLMGPLNLIVPINIITVFALSLFGVPALISFIFVYIIVF